MYEYNGWTTAVAVINNFITPLNIIHCSQKINYCVIISDIAFQLQPSVTEDGSL